jgi:hypothetical protein
MTEQTLSLADERATPIAGQERRATVRYSSPLQACCGPAPAHGVSTWRVPIRDVSELGIGLIFRYPHDLKSLLSVDLADAAGNLVRTVLARVVHITPLPGDTWVIGCSFVTELEDEVLRRFQAQRLRPAAPDSRAWVRFPCNVETVCTALDPGGDRVPARILDISAGGLGLLAPCDFAPGALLHMPLPPAPAQPPRNVLLRIIRSQARAHGDWLLGCEFADRLTAQELDALR